MHAERPGPGHGGGGAAHGPQPGVEGAAGRLLRRWEEQHTARIPQPVSLPAPSAVPLGCTLALHTTGALPNRASTNSISHLLPAPTRPHATPGASMSPSPAASAGRLAAQAEALSAALRAVDTCLAAHRRMQEALDRGVLEQQEQLDKVGRERTETGLGGFGRVGVGWRLTAAAGAAGSAGQGGTGAGGDGLSSRHGERAQGWAVIIWLLNRGRWLPHPPVPLDMSVLRFAQPRFAPYQLPHLCSRACPHRQRSHCSSRPPATAAPSRGTLPHAPPHHSLPMLPRTPQSPACSGPLSIPPAALTPTRRWASPPCVSAVSVTLHTVSTRLVRYPQVDTEHALTNARALVLKLQTLELQVLHHTYSRQLELAALRRVREELGHRADKLRAEVKEVRGAQPSGAG